MIKKWDIFHGKGAGRWQSKAAKDFFARSFNDLSQKCYLAPLIPLALFPLSSEIVDRDLLAIQVVLAVLFVLLGLVLRHEVLETLDENAEKEECSDE